MRIRDWFKSWYEKYLGKEEEGNKEWFRSQNDYIFIKLKKAKDSLGLLQGYMQQGDSEKALDVVGDAMDALIEVRQSLEGMDDEMAQEIIKMVQGLISYLEATRNKGVRNINFNKINQYIELLQRVLN